MDPLELYFWLALCMAGSLGLLLGYIIWGRPYRTEARISTKPRLHAAHPRYDVLDEVDTFMQDLGKRKP